MTRHMNPYRIAALVLVTAALAACEKNTVQTLPFEPPQNTRIKFFNFGVNAPQVNFYADAIKMTAVQSGTGVEANTGVAYGGAGNGGVYLSIAPGSHTLTGRIAAATDKDLPIATVNASLEDGKFYSFYQSGFYNTTAKTIDAFVIEDPVTAPADYTVASVRFVNAISNAAYPLTLFARATVGDTVTLVPLSAPVAYKGVGTFTTLPMGVYNLYARYTDSTTDKITRTGVSFFRGRFYTVSAFGDITLFASTTATNRPQLDNTVNQR